MLLQVESPRPSQRGRVSATSGVRSCWSVMPLALAAVVACGLSQTAKAQTPPGCNGNTVSMTITRSAAFVNIGDTVEFTLEVSVPSGSCQVINAEIRFWPPDAPPDAGNADICGSTNGVLIDSNLTLNPGDTVLYDSGDNSVFAYLATSAGTFTASGCATGCSQTGFDIGVCEQIGGEPATNDNQISFTVTDPQINIEKLADPSEICAGVPTDIQYTYTVTNPGTVELINVVVTDDQCAPVAFGGGDTDGDGRLDTNETWTYTCDATISQETTNVATASGNDRRTDKFVEDTTQFTVTENDPPVVTVVPEEANVCDGDSAEFCANTTGNGPFTYEWTGPNGFTADTECITVSVGGSYCVTVTDANGCEASSCGFLAVNPNPSVTVPNASACDGDSAELCANASGGTPGYTYLWDNGETTECITVDTPGDYCVTITDTNGCQASDCGTFFFNDSPSANVEDAAVCEGNSAEFCANASGGTPGYTYLWDSGETTECISTGIAGDHCVTVTDANGCVARDCGTLTVNDNPTVSVNDETVCDGDSAELCATPSGGTGPFTYAWDNGETTECITVSAGGDYCVTVTDSNGCEGTGCGTLTVNDNPEATASNDGPICEGDDGHLSSGPDGATYEWTGPNNFASTEQNPTVSPAVAGEYCVTVTDENGCTDSACTTMVVEPCNQTFCTLTPGAYGNANGSFAGLRRLALIQNLLSSGPLVVGKPGRSLTINQAQAQCIINRLPAGGPASALPANLGDATMDANCNTSPQLPLKNGKFQNVFLGHVITLSLNVRIDIDGHVGPGEFELSAQFCIDNGDGTASTYTISQSVLDALDNLGLPNTVFGLLELANRALAGWDTGGASLSAIHSAVSTINEAFDECQTTTTCATARADVPVADGAAATGGQQGGNDAPAGDAGQNQDNHPAPQGFGALFSACSAANASILSLLVVSMIAMRQSVRRRRRS